VSLEHMELTLLWDQKVIAHHALLEVCAQVDQQWGQRAVMLDFIVLQ